MKKIYRKIQSIDGNVISVVADDVAYGSLALVYSQYTRSLAEVIRLEKDLVYLQVFQGAKGISTEDRVEFLGHSMQVSFSQDLLGRVFDGAGNPKDGKSALNENLIPIKSPSINPSSRCLPSQMIRTNIPMIDMFNTLVESQKLPIFSVSGEPYNELLARIAVQAEVDVIVIGGIGLRFADYLNLKQTLEEQGALSRSIFFVHLASDSVVEGIIAPDISLAVAEQFALQGKKVLVLLTDMTNFANALKEISIIMEQVPANRGYPGDLYSQLAWRYEKAVAFDKAGSVTILGVTTMPGDDVTHPVPDNTGYITEGQYYLKGGHIEPFGSLSRLKQMVNGKTRKDHRTLMDTMIRLYAASRETGEKRSMGFQMSSWDEKLTQYGKLFEEKMMSLEVNLSLEKALDLGWVILATCFDPQETGIPTDMIDQFWPKSVSKEIDANKV